jgi:hypothetical protein
VFGGSHCWAYFHFVGEMILLDLSGAIRTSKAKKLTAGMKKANRTMSILIGTPVVYIADTKVS